MFRKTISEDALTFFFLILIPKYCMYCRLSFSKLDSPVCELFCCEVQYKFHQAWLQQHSVTVCTVCVCSRGIHTCSASTPRRGYCESGIAGYNCNLTTPWLNEEAFSPAAVIVRTREGINGSTHSTGSLLESKDVTRVATYNLVLCANFFFFRKVARFTFNWRQIFMRIILHPHKERMRIFPTSGVYTKRICVMT